MPVTFRKVVIEQNSSELNGIQAISFILGPCSSTTETDEDYLHDNNFLYTKELCEWSSKLMVSVLSMHLPQQPMEMVIWAWMTRDEDIEKFQPLNLYGWSKHKFDLLAKENGLVRFNIWAEIF